MELKRFRLLIASLFGGDLLIVKTSNEPRERVLMSEIMMCDA